MGLQDQAQGRWLNWTLQGSHCCKGILHSALVLTLWKHLPQLQNGQPLEPFLPLPLLKTWNSKVLISPLLFLMGWWTLRSIWWIWAVWPWLGLQADQRSLWSEARFTTLASEVTLVTLSCPRLDSREWDAVGLYASCDFKQHFVVFLCPTFICILNSALIIISVLSVSGPFCVWVRGTSGIPFMCWRCPLAFPSSVFSPQI